MFVFSRFLLLLAGYFLVGCQSMQVGKKYTGQIKPFFGETPANWSSTAIARSGVDENWLSSFRDDKLQEFMGMALSTNLDMRAAASQLEIARRDAKLSGINMFPKLNLRSSGSRAQSNTSGSPFADIFNDPSNRPSDVPQDGPAVFENESYGLSMDLSWELDLWGRIRAGRKAGYAAYEASRLDYKAARISMAGQIAKLWFSLREAAVQSALSHRLVELSRQTEEAVRDRFEYADEAARGSLAQYRLAQADTKTAESNLAARHQLRDSMARQLETLLGRYPSRKILEDLEGVRGLPRLPRPTPAGMPSQLLLRRPDILAAEQRWLAQGYRVREAQLAKFPQISLTGSTGTSTDALKNILNSDYSVWNFGNNLLQPILTGGQIRAEKGKRAEQQKLAMIELQKTVLNAFSEVENTLSNERYLVAQVRALGAAVKYAEEAQEEARANYGRGVGDFLTLLAAQQRQLQALSQLHSLRYQLLENRINLHLALGGDFDAPIATASSETASNNLPRQ